MEQSLVDIAVVAVEIDFVVAALLVVVDASEAFVPDKAFLPLALLVVYAIGTRLHQRCLSVLTSSLAIVSSSPLTQIQQQCQANFLIRLHWRTSSADPQPQPIPCRGGGIVDLGDLRRSLSLP